MTQREFDAAFILHKRAKDNNPDGKLIDLDFADIHNLELNDIDLSETYITGANFSGAVASFVDFHTTSFYNCNFTETDFYRADFTCASFHNCNFTGAQFEGANFRDAKFDDGTILDGVTYDNDTAYFALQCPEEGSFVGWKKCWENAIVKLLIPEDAKRSSATSRKCRCDKAIVLDIRDEYGNHIEEVASKRNASFIYRVGAAVSVPDFDENRWHECTTGIHFFITRREAESYDN